jgi:hypothetical protein
MTIQPNKNQLENEIDTLHQSIESLNAKRSIQNEEISILRADLNQIQIALSNEINDVYSRNKIHNSIADFYSYLNGVYYAKYKVNLVDEELNFKKEFYKKIKETTIESIFSTMTFKHNNAILKAKGIFLFTSIAVLAGIFIHFANEYGTTRGFFDGIEYNFLGYILIIFSGICILAAMGVLITLSSIKSEVVIGVIQNGGGENFQELINYLNSIHKLPTEIKNLIK